MSIFERLLKKRSLANIDWDTDASLQGLYAAMRLDPCTHGLLTVEGYPHHEIHAGEAHYCYKSILLASGEKSTIALITPDTNKLSHFTYTLIVSGETDFDILEDVASFANGATFNIINRHRMLAAAPHNMVSGSGCLVSSDAGADTAIVPTGGNEIDYLMIGAGKFGGDDRTVEEILLNKNTKYLFRLASGANGNRTTMKLSWYEHEAIHG